MITTMEELTEFVEKCAYNGVKSIHFTKSGHTSAVGQAPLNVDRIEFYEPGEDSVARYRPVRHGSG